MRKYIIALLTATSLLSGCKKDHDNTPNALAGIWTEQERVPQFAGTHYKLQLRADGGFDMSIQYFTDVADSNPCASGIAYIRGNWSVSGSKSIMFKGYYTDETFTENRPEPCSGKTDYAATFGYRLYRANVLILNPQLDEYSSVYLVQQ